MPYVVVDNFSGGLDSRRHVLNSKTGTMSVLKNAHVTRGGEIEKRKAFVQYADVSETALGVETFGMEATADGIYVFGWEPAPATMPAGIIYQQLRHPQSYPGDGVYPPTSDYAITKIVYSTVYGGKPFVIAEFDLEDGSVSRMAFYDGVAIKDWYEGFLFKPEFIIEYDIGEAATDILNKLVSYFPVGGYTATGSYYDDVPTGALSAWVLDVTGPIGKPFTLTSNIEGVFDGGSLEYPLAPTVVTTQTHKVEVPETLSSGSFSITGGNTTAAKTYQTGRNLDAAALPGIRSIRVGASSAAAADGTDLIGWGGATGLKYNTYTPTYTTGSNCGSLYYNIRKAINDNTTAGLTHGYSANSYLRSYNSGNDTNDLVIYAPPSQGSNANGDLVQIEFDADPTGVGTLYDIIIPSTIAPSPYNVGKFIATHATLSGGSFNRINSVKVDGKEVLGAPVSWENSHGATAAAVAVQINAYTSSPEYVATTTDGSKVVLTAASGTGKTPNGRIISVETEGTVVISGITPMSGGLDAVAAIPQITRVSFYPSYNFIVKAGGKYGVTIIDPDNPSVPIIVGASRVAGKSPGSSVTYKSKEYAAVGSTLYFSAVNDATKWDIYDTGSGFIDMSNNFGGREDITGMGVYQNYLAVFNRRSVQLWSMDADPANNSQVQIIANTGALSPDSIVSVGSIDLLYLADNGVRSLRARENTDTAFSSDIGSAIDSIVISHMEELDTTNYGSLGYDTKYTAKAIIEPIDGRYWLSLGGKIYVLSYFPGSNISAWSLYETDQWEVVTEMVTREDKVYTRDEVGKIYIYGFDLNAPSIDDRSNIYDSCEVVVELPYLDGNKPATYKEAKGIDMTCAGEWKVYLGFDHTNPTARDLVATVTQPTFALGKITATGAGTHFGPRFVNQSAGPALLANFIVHFDEMHSKHDAG
ncbi:hypothetical protein UFOVP291_38 [uncultured Caudovirales phage]|uniref:Uncharacterized protein n=1 Tax=uncultured Caudovirales phage TaxID=2100421 RepID=A0A6J5LRA5_9CAUD|nr:hypothetical protein UFOVP291_38 [uncultured Caudovirales phage]